MNALDIGLLALVLAYAVWVICRQIKKKKSGCTGCCGSCSGCSGCGKK